MGCLFLEIEGQSCLVDRVDQDLMKNRHIGLLDRMAKNNARRKKVTNNRFFQGFSRVRSNLAGRVRSGRIS